jgi:hypothetical protein
MVVELGSPWGNGCDGQPDLEGGWVTAPLSDRIGILPPGSSQTSVTLDFKDTGSPAVIEAKAIPVDRGPEGGARGVDGLLDDQVAEVLGRGSVEG